MREMGTADAPATDGSDGSPARAGHWHDGPAAVTADPLEPPDDWRADTLAAS